MLRHDTPRPDGGSAWLERCEQPRPCGVWYDGSSLPALHARFADEEVASALYEAPNADVAPARRIECPRCEAHPPLTAVVFAGITLDVCERCRGLWVDREEYAALMHAMTLYSPTLREAAGPVYRSARVQRAMIRAEDWARCVGCRAEIAFADALFTERGLVCVVCGLAVQDHDREAAATTSLLDDVQRWMGSVDAALLRLLGRA